MRCSYILDYWCPTSTAHVSPLKKAQQKKYQQKSVLRSEFERDHLFNLPVVGFNLLKSFPFPCWLWGLSLMREKVEGWVWEEKNKGKHQQVQASFLFVIKLLMGRKIGYTSCSSLHIKYFRMYEINKGEKKKGTATKDRLSTKIGCKIKTKIPLYELVVKMVPYHHTWWIDDNGYRNNVYAHPM